MSFIGKKRMVVFN